MLTWLTLHIPMYLGVTQAECDADRAKKFLGIFPTWYAYIKDYGPKPAQELGCGFGQNLVVREYAVQIGLAVIDILLRAGALAAVVFIIMGGYKYISSQGEPKNIEAAMATIVNAAIGLGIVIFATVLVAFIGNTLGG
jgi:hypothetical protein